MNIDKIKDAKTPLEAIQMIKLNEEVYFVWTFVKGKNGCIYTMGGSNWNGELQMLISIPFYEKGLPKLRPNGYVRENFPIGYNLEYFKTNLVKVSYDEFIEYSKQDLRKLIINEELEPYTLNIKRSLKFI